MRQQLYNTVVMKAGVLLSTIQKRKQGGEVEGDGVMG